MSGSPKPADGRPGHRNYNAVDRLLRDSGAATAGGPRPARRHGRCGGGTESQGEIAGQRSARGGVSSPSAREVIVEDPRAFAALTVASGQRNGTTTQPLPALRLSCQALPAGLFVLPRFLSAAHQLALATRVIGRYSREAVTNRRPHYGTNFGAAAEGGDPASGASPLSPSVAPSGALWPKLRWLSLGVRYNWQDRVYEPTGGDSSADGGGIHEPPPALPRELTTIARAAIAHCRSATTVDWHVREALGAEKVVDRAEGQGAAAEEAATTEAEEENVQAAPACGDTLSDAFHPDCALVNFYHSHRSGDRLFGHRDDAEDNLTCPLVAVTLGNRECEFLVSSSLDACPVAITLRGGDVVVMSGAARLVVHGVPAVRGRGLAKAAATPKGTHEQDDGALALCPSLRLWATRFTQEVADDARRWGVPAQALLDSTRVNISIRTVAQRK